MTATTTNNVNETEPQTTNPIGEEKTDDKKKDEKKAYVFTTMQQAIDDERSPQEIGQCGKLVAQQLLRHMAKKNNETALDNATSIVIKSILSDVIKQGRKGEKSAMQILSVFDDNKELIANKVMSVVTKHHRLLHELATMPTNVTLPSVDLTGQQVCGLYFNSGVTNSAIAKKIVG